VWSGPEKSGRVLLGNPKKCIRKPEAFGRDSMFPFGDKLFLMSSIVFIYDNGVLTWK
jgi:hypothetical protein